MLLLLHKTLKGSRNIEGFALIRVVLLNLLLIFILITHTKKKRNYSGFSKSTGFLCYKKSKTQKYCSAVSALVQKPFLTENI